MAIGVIVLIVLAVPTLFQLVVQGGERRRQHNEILARLDRIESKMTGSGQ
ncbi:MAG: hypothetical protein JSW50_11980 [Candidatus Latescibacterota bacterium]|nr:MAG: hypothetical protein JSW50_11980 [Candidatus Latescibacterota bacterium]